MEPNVTQDMLAVVWSQMMAGKYAGGSMLGIIPALSLGEFMDKLHAESYDPDHIYEVWKELPEDLIRNNEACGVCPAGYIHAPTK